MPTECMSQTLLVFPFCLCLCLYLRHCISFFPTGSAGISLYTVHYTSPDRPQLHKCLNHPNPYASALPPSLTKLRYPIKVPAKRSQHMSITKPQPRTKIFPHARKEKRRGRNKMP
ncbi:hypothetical protein BKA65DRAFT_504641 [Rhexocercosporidium sp. MPI-PUGE-AT-0058]|nr:hypothetical protein BKA65DRAFT_504641 [Rhexocercosporidium sp. MPI-PUGE-AT-0058]